MAKEIKDFGEKIGGARKDFYAVALNTKDMDNMNEAEKKKYVKRDSIWKKEDAAALIASGVPREVAYWRNEMRIGFPPKPKQMTENYLKRYIQTAETVRDLVLNVKTVNERNKFYEQVFYPAFLEGSGYRLSVKEDVRGFITQKLVSAASIKAQTLKKLSLTYGMSKEDEVRTLADLSFIIGEIGKEVEVSDGRERVQVSYKIPGGRSFFYGDNKTPKASDWIKGSYTVLDGKSHRILMVNCTKEEAVQGKASFIELLVSNTLKKEKEQKTNPKRKRNFPIPEISNVLRKGPEYRTEQITGDKLIREFGIRGGEFGHWMSDADAEESLNRCYDAFCDLARILDVPSQSLSFHGKLVIGFGSRGHSAATAHYEPARQVINLTKYRGHGALCHEWAHALDHAIGQHYGCREFASEEAKNPNLPKELKELLNAFVFKEIFLSNDEAFEQSESRIMQLYKAYLKQIDRWKPRNDSEEVLIKWETLVQALWVSADMSHLDALSKMRKQSLGHVIPKQERNNIARYVRCGYLEKKKQEEETTLKTSRGYTDFYVGSKKFDGLFTRMGHQYWSSKCEMFARAFDCYISDKLKERGEENSYLTYGADAFQWTLEGKRYAAVPEGEERKKLNQMFDRLLETLKREHVL